MAHVSNGPVTTMPGRWFAARAGHTCDTDGHHDRPSVKMRQGETDSFGAEYEDFCQECYGAFLAKPAEEPVGHCDWCSKGGLKVFSKRDMNEGSSGPVYYVCIPCATKHDKEFEEDADLYYADEEHRRMMEED